MLFGAVFDGAPVKSRTLERTLIQQQAKHGQIDKTNCVSSGRIAAEIVNPMRVNRQEEEAPNLKLLEQHYDDTNKEQYPTPTHRSSGPLEE